MNIHAKLVKFWLGILLVSYGCVGLAVAADLGDDIESKSVYPVTFADNLSEDDYLGELPKVLTVSRLKQSAADAPSAVTVIDRETIRASGIVDLPEIFRLVPGMYVGANAGYVYSTNHTVSYHGITNAYSGSMQVMINGRSVYTPLFGGVKWSELPIALMDIERIEVTRGPNAASYGANSFFGVINIITINPAESPKNTVLATHGSGRNEAFYRHAGKLDDWAYRATVGYRQDDGLDNRNDFKRTRFINAQADYQINPTNLLEFEMGATDGARGEGNINEDNLVFLPRTKQINNYFALARWRLNLSDSSDLSVQAFHSYDRSDDKTTSVLLAPIFPPPRRPFVAIDRLRINNEVIQQRTDIEAQHTFAVGDNIRAVWGGSVRRDSTEAPFYLGTDNTDYFDLQRLFGHVEWRPHSMWTFNLGAMMEHNDFTGTDTSPRASINFKPHPNHAFRLGISSALRTPNYVEEKFNNRYFIPAVQPNPLTSTAFIFQLTANKGNVNPEKIVSREIGYVGKIGSLQLDTRIFSDRIDDIIRGEDNVDFTFPANTVPLNTKPVEGAVNRGSAAVEGIELQAKWHLNKDTDILLGHSHINIRETQPRLKKTYTQSAPNNTLTALVTYRFNSDWDASFAYYQTSKVSALGDGDPVDLIRRADARLARKFITGHVNGEVSIAIENLFDSDYEEFADYNTLKRRGQINLKLNF